MAKQMPLPLSRLFVGSKGQTRRVRPLWHHRLTEGSRYVLGGEVNIF
jgi:hypothetical protein